MAIQPQENFDLSSYNTLAVPCVCAFFCGVSTQTELMEALTWARSNKLSFYILGGGSNALLPECIDGLVIHIELKGVHHTIKKNNVLVSAAAGENWHEFVELTLKNTWFGLENLSLIPGSVGASPIQNIGAYGVELSDRFYSAKVLNLETLSEQVLYKKDCAFSYRESIFKTDLGKRKFIILSVCFELSLNADVCIEYPALRQVLQKELKHALREPLEQTLQKPIKQVVPQARGNNLNKGLSADNITPQQVSDAVISIRKSKLPAPQDIPNVGSFFKNPRLTGDEFKQLRSRFSHTENHIPSYCDSLGSHKIPAAWLIDQSGWKGQFVDGVGVHDKQALVLINPKKLSLSKVLALAKLIQDDVYDRFGIHLHIEPQGLSHKV